MGVAEEFACFEGGESGADLGITDLSGSLILYGKPDKRLLKTSAEVGGPSTQFTSQGPSSVINTTEPAVVHASWTMRAGM